MTNFYINRTLHFEDRLVLDEYLLQETGVILVLAEPGAGKTEFLKFLSRRLGVEPVLATIFQHAALSKNLPALVIDGLDEVARIDESGTNAILVKASSANATTVIMASRSYILDEARTNFIKDCFKQAPKVIRLEPLKEIEQQRIFEAYLPGEDFRAFHKEAERFELTPILGNPQFLKLLADAFVEGGRQFTSKAQIYVDAVNKLASERSTTLHQRNRPPISAIVDCACEIFAKLLLSGAVGVSSSEETEDTVFPYIRSLTRP